MRLLCIIAMLCLVAVTPAAQAADVTAAVLRVAYQKQLPLSRIDEPVADLGFAGARLATEDNQTTGMFLGHSYAVETIETDSAGIKTAVDDIKAQGIGVIVTLANAADTLHIAELAGPETLVLNALAHDTALRNEQCRANLLHTAPSYAMLADAVAQFAIWKKWPKWVLIHGSNPDDLQMAEAYRNAAAKFGARIVEERMFEDTGGSRATDSGHVLVQRQIPVFTQGLKKHDVVIAADESEVFGGYLSYHSWEPSVVMGGGGLRPVSFNFVNEAYGAAQFQTRFEKLANRFVREQDFDAWVALRAVGEAVTRTGSADPSVIRDYLLSGEFGLASFKGGAVSFRDWNGQLRQPIILSDIRTVVSISPQEGFLHQSSPLDTMGLDRAESQCTAFN